VFDGVQLAGELLRGEPEDHGRRLVAVDGDARALHIGAGLLDGADTLGLAVGDDLFRRGLGLGPAAGVLILALDQFALAPGQFDLVRKLVFGDGPLLLDGEGPPLEGGLVGVLLQPKAVPAFQWTRHVLDSEEGRNPPERFDSRPLLALVKRRYQQLNQAIVDRQWFDPWVFEMQGEDEEDEAEPSEVVFPWVAGFALATERFPELMREDAADLLEPLAAIFMHLDPDDLEDADDLLEEIESLEPPKDLEEAVEGLVSACLMLADVSRPQAKPAAPQRPPARRGPPPRGRY